MRNHVSELRQALAEAAGTLKGSASALDRLYPGLADMLRADAEKHQALLDKIHRERLASFDEADVVAAMAVAALAAGATP